MPGLGHVNCYALEDERGVALVDPGLPGTRPWKDLVAALGRAGFPLKYVHTVVVTHSHPDHFGGSGRLRKETGADILTHRSFRTFWDPEEDATDDAELAGTASPESTAASVPHRGNLPERTGRFAWDRPTPWGGEHPRPEFKRRLRFHAMYRLRRFFGTPTPSRRVDDADVVRLAKREWVALHTPGHTSDHLCLYDPTEGVLLSGDHVLPTITPHISGLSRAADPLAEFFASLDRVAKLDGVSTVLPAHGHPFEDLPGRVKAIERHHEERLDKLVVASHGLGRPATVPEFSQHLFSPRAWGPMADSETYAHLEHLRLLGKATREHRDGILLYELG